MLVESPALGVSTLGFIKASPAKRAMPKIPPSSCARLRPSLSLNFARFPMDQVGEHPGGQSVLRIAGL